MMERLVLEHTFPGSQSLKIVHGDLTEQRVDAIVNAANAHLIHGGGVAGAIAHRGGPQIQAESQAWVREHGPVPHDQPAYTSAGNLPCRYVIHVVGPVWGEGDEDTKLASAVRGSLEVAERLSLASLAMPAISTGIFGFPRLRAARVILGAIREYYAAHPDSALVQVRMVLIDQASIEAFVEAWESFSED
jgi:O-acetyl-ADP-ribose deacetylase (regulator of RNase III)